MISCDQDCHGDGMQADFFDVLFSEHQVMSPALAIFEPSLGKTNKVIQSVKIQDSGPCHHLHLANF